MSRYPRGPFWRVRVVMPGGTLHLASASEPRLKVSDQGIIYGLEMQPLEGAEYGDSVGYISWGHVVAVTWRQSAAEAADGGAVKAAFVELLAGFNAHGRAVSHKPKANNYAPTAFAGSEEGNRYSREDYRSAMDALLAEGRIKVGETSGPPSKRRPALEIAA